MKEYKIFGPSTLLKEVGQRMKKYGEEGGGLFIMQMQPEKIGIRKSDPLDYRIDLGFIAFQIWIEPCEFSDGN